MKFILASAYFCIVAHLGFSQSFNTNYESPRIIVEECENLDTLSKIQECAERKMLEFIFMTIRMPVSALENGVSGQVIVKISIDSTGEVTNRKVLKDIGYGCGAEALYITKLLEKEYDFRPAYRNGKPEAGSLILPFRFKVIRTIQDRNKQQE